MPNQTWIDLTDFAEWNGRFTGIQRVIYSISKEFSLDSETKYFVFSPTKGFSEVTFDEVVGTKKAADDKMRSNITSQRAFRLAHRVTRKLHGVSSKYSKRALMKVYSYAPDLIKDGMKAYKSKQDLRKNPILIKDVEHPFGDGDKIVILGASWYYPTIIQNLAAIKKEKNLKILHIVYDLIPVLFPHYFGEGFGDYYKAHMFDAISISDGLLSISKNTKRDVEKFQKDLELPKIPIHVIRLGDEPTNNPAKTSPDKRVKSGEYVLAVGTLEVRKNYLMLYYVWKRALSSGMTMPKLVIVGRPGWLFSESMHLMVNDPQTRNHIFFLSDLSDEDLGWLYLNCLFTVYPAWYEGWGLPIAESLNYNKLCLASETSSMQEIAGDAIEYFDPYNPIQALELIKKYYDSPSELKAAEEKIQLQYTPASWTKTHKDVSKAIELL